jgi:hypothetical protein
LNCKMLASDYGFPWTKISSTLYKEQRTSANWCLLFCFAGIHTATDFIGISTKSCLQKYTSNGTSC